MSLCSSVIHDGLEVRFCFELKVKNEIQNGKNAHSKHFGSCGLNKLFGRKSLFSSARFHQLHPLCYEVPFTLFETITNSHRNAPDSILFFRRSKCQCSETKQPGGHHQKSTTPISQKTS